MTRVKPVGSDFFDEERYASSSRCTVHRVAFTSRVLASHSDSCTLTYDAEQPYAMSAALLNNGEFLL